METLSRSESRNHSQHLNRQPHKTPETYTTEAPTSPIRPSRCRTTVATGQPNKPPSAVNKSRPGNTTPTSNRDIFIISIDESIRSSDQNPLHSHCRNETLHPNRTASRFDTVRSWTRHQQPFKSADPPRTHYADQSSHHHHVDCFRYMTSSIHLFQYPTIFRRGGHRENSVPLLEEVKQDRMIWKAEQDDIYSVRTGYKLWYQAVRGREDVEGAEDWSSIWNIKAPPRVKHLLWRICRGCLPTRMRLRQRLVSCPLTCQLCEHTTEDEWHLFLGCNVTNQCWKEAGLSILIESRLHSFQDMKSLIFDICSKEDKRLAGKFAVMLDVIWKNRNDFVWNNEQEEGAKLGLRAAHHWNDWFQAQEGSESIIRPQYALEWSPPSVGRLKCNVDAAFNKNNGTTNRGWCVRNHLGHFIYAGAAWDPGTLPVFEAEAMALKEAILGAVSLHLELVTFESDSQIVTQAIQSNRKGDSEFSLIIESISSLLHSFPNFEVKFVRRQANMVAHSLARAANSWARRSVLLSPPHCIEHLLINELH